MVRLGESGREVNSFLKSMWIRRVMVRLGESLKKCIIFKILLCIVNHFTPHLAYAHSQADMPDDLEDYELKKNEGKINK